MITFACRELFSNPLNLRNLDILHDNRGSHARSHIHHLSQLSQQLVVSSLLPSESLVAVLIGDLDLEPGLPPSHQDEVVTPKGSKFLV